MTLLAAFAITATAAQINNGAWLIGASSNMAANNYTSKTSADVFTFNLNIQGGNFIIDNLVLGLNTGFTSLSQGGSNQAQTTLGIFSRYYFPKNFFAGAGVNSYWFSNNSGNSESHAEVRLEAGYAAFISNSCAIEPSISYRGVTDPNYTGRISSLSFNLGFMIYLHRK